MLIWLFKLLGFGAWRCDGCGVKRLCISERAQSRIETVEVPAIGDAPAGEYRAVRLYCRTCAAARKEG